MSEVVNRTRIAALGSMIALILASSMLVVEGPMAAGQDDEDAIRAAEAHAEGGDRYREGLDLLWGTGNVEADYEAAIAAFEEAEELLEEATKLDKENDVAWLDLVRVRLALRKFKDARKALRRYKSLMDDYEMWPDADGLMLYAESYRQEGNFRKAVDYYSDALEIMDPEDEAWTAFYVEAINLRGNCRQYIGKFEEALADYEQANEYADYPDLFNVADVYRCMGRLDEAIATYTEVIDDYDDMWAFNNRGICHYLQTDYSRAIADWDKAIELGAGSFDEQYIVCWKFIIAKRGGDTGAGRAARDELEAWYDGYENSIDCEPQISLLSSFLSPDRYLDRIMDYVEERLDNEEIEQWQADEQMVDAFFYVGAYYEVVDKDLDRAREFYEKAADLDTYSITEWYMAKHALENLDGDGDD